MKSSDINNKKSELKTQRLIAAMYARVSTEKQENEQTIKSQIEEIRKRIKEDKHILPKENIFIDDGWTGSILERPGLDAMRDAADAGNFQVFYVYDRGRLSRDFYHQEVIIRSELNPKNIQFVTLHDLAGDNPESKLMQSVQGIFHEYEKIKIAERFRRGKLHKAKHEIINGQALYGYQIIREEDEPRRY